MLASFRDETGFRSVGSLLGLAAAVAAGAMSMSYFSGSRAQRRLMEIEKQKTEDAERRAAEAERREREARQKYEAYLQNLVGERRAAEVIVLDQKTDEHGDVETKLKFLEYSTGGKTELSPKVLTVKGDEVYFDALVMQFEKGQVKEGKARSLYLFRRIFTDKTQPEKGFQLLAQEGDDPVPKDYVSQEIPGTAQQVVWEEFRKCIRDPKYAEEKRVRTIFGQAVYKRLEKDNIYRLTIQNDGGLVIEEKPYPPILRTAPDTEESPQPPEGAGGGTRKDGRP